MVCKIRDKRFLRCVKTQASKFRDRLVVKRELIKEVFLEERRLELGRFRHGERFMQYDAIVKDIQERWLTPETHGLAQEIIHSVSNKANDIILECVYEAMEDIYKKESRRADVLEILLEERTKKLQEYQNKEI